MLAVALAEYFLRRPLRSVLDIGCGEGAWLPHLRALRPRVDYTGLDQSSYAVKRYGASRNIRRGSFGELSSLDLEPSYDLLICSDVLHYVSDGDLRAGMPEVAQLCGGLAYLEVLTREDDIIGDLEGLIQRPAAFYRSAFSRAGFLPVGPYAWLSPELRDDAAEMERP